MKLTFEYTQTIREGLSPQVVHMMDNGIRVIYLSNDGLVKGLEAFPGLGLYDNLTFKDIGRVSADMEVSKPSLKKVAHYGAYGFWSSDSMHKFIMYMLPTDISNALMRQHLLFQGQCYFSATIKPAKLVEYVSRNWSVVAPNTVMRCTSLGESSEFL